MMGNRKQPFGYKMSLGEIVIQESEAKLVQEVFRRYIAGESLNELTESLRQQDISYDEGRLWNKNMVARILADTRYTGEKEYQIYPVRIRHWPSLSSRALLILTFL